MLNALEIRKKEKKEALRSASDYINKLQKDISPLSAFVYGSFARGDFNAGSDIDIVIISDLLPREPFKRLELLYKYANGNIEPKGYTKDEFLNLITRGYPWIIDILEKGINLKDDNLIRESYKKVRYG